MKVLDFGLAKTFAEDTVEADNSRSPTLAREATRAGALLGTAPYMSPEQARGQDVDVRSDIWSFGCVLWECLTGQRLFGGATLSDSIGAILHTEPDWGRLPADTPPAVRRLLRRCLAKDARQRLHHIADARIELEDSDPTAPAAGRSTRGYKIIVAVLTIALVASLAAAGLLLLRLRADQPASGDNPLAGARFTRITDDAETELQATISPDGRFVAFISDRDGPFDVFVGQIGLGEFRNLTLGKAGPPASTTRNVGFIADGSEIWFGRLDPRGLATVPLLGGPVRNLLGQRVIDVGWSPDGRRMVYFEADDGDPVYVANRDGTNRRRILRETEGRHQHDPVWSVDGQWIYLTRGRQTTSEMDLWRVRPDGTEPERLTRRELEVRYPTPITERTVLFVARDADGAGPWLWAWDAQTRLSRRASLGLEQYGSLAASANRRRLVATVEKSRAELWRVPILDRTATESDAERLPELKTPRALAPRFGGASLFFLSSRGSGDGLWRLSAGQAIEIWRGSETALLEPAAVSPDGASVVVRLRRGDRWRLQVLSADGVPLRGLSESVDARGAAAWSPDGLWIVTEASVAGVQGLYKVPVDGGSPERIVDGEALNPVWSPDGDLIVYAGAQVAESAPLLGVRPDGEAVEMPGIMVNRLGERARFLPDGSGLVYMSNSERDADFWLLDLDTMETRQLTRLEGAATMRTFDVTPDGQRIVFDRLRDDSDVVLIELPAPRPGPAPRRVE